MNKNIFKRSIVYYQVVKENSDVKGYWLNDNKLYRDNVRILHITPLELYKLKKSDFDKSELAVFYIQNNTAYIEYKNNNPLTILKNRTIKKFSRLKDHTIKKYCQKFGGCTIHKKENHYILEYWY